MLASFQRKTNKNGFHRKEKRLLFKGKLATFKENYIPRSWKLISTGKKEVSTQRRIDFNSNRKCRPLKRKLTSIQWETGFHSQKLTLLKGKVFFIKRKLTSPWIKNGFHTKKRIYVHAKKEWFPLKKYTDFH